MICYFKSRNPLTNWSSVCSESWSQSWSDLACKQLGFSESEETDLTQTPAFPIQLQLNDTFNVNETLIQEAVQDEANCSQVVGLTCKSSGIKSVEETLLDFKLT